MKRHLGIASIFVIVGVGAGCGRKEGETGRYNEALNGLASGTPMSSRVDLGILQDPASYKPAKGPSAAAAPADSGTAKAGAGGGDSGPEVDAVRGSVKSALQSAAEGNFSGVLELFVPEKIAALQKPEVASAIADAGGAAQLLLRALQTKNATWAEAHLASHAVVIEGMSGAISVKVVDAENAALSFDPAKLMELMQKIAPPGAAAAAPPTPPSEGGGAEGGRHARVASPPEEPANPRSPRSAPDATAPPDAAATPAAGELPDASQLAALAGQSIPLKKVGDAWKIDLPAALTDEHGDLVKEAFEIARTILVTAQEKVDAAPQLDDATFAQIMQQSLMPQLPALMGLWGRLLSAQSNAASDAPKQEKPADAPALQP
jgi:hypothetical protein